MIIPGWSASEKNHIIIEIHYFLCSPYIPAGIITINQVESIIQNLPEDLQMKILKYTEKLYTKSLNMDWRFSFDWIGELEDEEPTL